MIDDSIYNIDLSGIKNNVLYIKNKYSDYKYYIGVVKANAYGCGYLNTIKTMEEAGINFFAVTNIDEARKVRKYTNLGILIMSNIPKYYINECIKDNYSVMVDSINYLKGIGCISNLKIHISINTGMNRYGISDIEEINDIINYSSLNGAILEGIYTHLYYASNKDITMNQINKFYSILENIDKKDIPIVHVMNSEGLLYYDKFKYTTGIRIGDLLYGLTYLKEFKSVFSLKSRISEIRYLKKGDTLGYDASYSAEKDEVIAVVQIGYNNGIVKKNTKRSVYINNKEYYIVGNICMCNLFVKIDESVNINDVVYIIKDSKHVMDISKYLDTAPSEVTCIIDKDIKKEYEVEGAIYE